MKLPTSYNATRQQQTNVVAHPSRIHAYEDVNEGQLSVLSHTRNAACLRRVVGYLPKQLILFWKSWLNVCLGLRIVLIPINAIIILFIVAGGWIGSLTRNLVNVFEHTHTHQKMLNRFFLKSIIVVETTNKRSVLYKNKKCCRKNANTKINSQIWQVTNTVINWNVWNSIADLCCQYKWFEI